MGATGHMVSQAGRGIAGDPLEKKGRPDLRGGLSGERSATPAGEAAGPELAAGSEGDQSGDVHKISPPQPRQ